MENIWNEDKLLSPIIVISRFSTVVIGRRKLKINMKLWLRKIKLILKHTEAKHSSFQNVKKKSQNSLLLEMALTELAEVIFNYSYAMKNTVINCHQFGFKKSRRAVSELC